MLKSKKINLNQIKKKLFEKGFIVTKKKNSFLSKDLKSFYFTTLCSFGLIMISALIPLSVNIKQDINISKSTIDNNSSVNFQKVLDGKPLKEDDIDQILDTKNLFEDIFSFDEMPTDTVRLSASTVKELFKDRWFISTPCEMCEEHHVKKINDLWKNFGSQIETMSPKDHDSIMAITSHIPHLIAYNIVGTASDLEADLKNDEIKFSASSSAS